MRDSQHSPLYYCKHYATLFFALIPSFSSHFSFSLSPPEKKLRSGVTKQGLLPLPHHGARLHFYRENTCFFPRRIASNTLSDTVWDISKKLVLKSMDTLLKGLTVGRKYELACLMLYAEDAFPVDAEVGFVCVWQSSHAGLHACHEVRPRHPRLVTLEANKRL